MRLMVGKKDIFLSYAHVDIKFARKIKVRVSPPMSCVHVRMYGRKC